MVRRTDLDDIIEGDDKSYSLTIRDAQGNPLDITGWTVFVTVKEDTSDSDADALISKDITSHDEPKNGKTSFSFTSSETDGITGTKEFDVQTKDTANDISTVLRGEVTFKSDVTNRTS
jgi:hypothetical protein